ncbi:MAG TPA: hypothetical protein VFB38_08635 [Chthonomonadaceae bacterium]|nr:hypothetical protein [Chthonomonadaceae bacterium]
MAGQAFNAYRFENGQFVPHNEPNTNGLQWAAFLAQQGYAEPEQVWGPYPDVYIKVYEARPDAQARFQFVAICNLVTVPHRVFIRDINGLIQLLNLLMPLFAQYSRPEEQVGEALFGSQGAQEESPEDMIE